MINFLLFCLLGLVALVVYLVWDHLAKVERETARRFYRYTVPRELRSCGNCENKMRPGYLEPCRGCLEGFYLEGKPELEGWE